MGYEVELKFRVADHVGLAGRLRDRGLVAGLEVEHVDLYLAHPARDFAATGEAFRIRSEGTLNRITYKGAKLSGLVKTREEIEVEFAEGSEAREQLVRAFGLLGFEPVAEVRKSRGEYHLDYRGRPMSIALDRAEGLGSFAEVETLAEGPERLVGAQEAVLGLAGELGLSEVEPRSYLRMLLESRGLLSRNPAGQT